MADKDNFFEALDAYSAGERAVLRRNCGKLLKDADGQSIVLFYRVLPRSVPDVQADRWFAAACFSCLWDSSQRGEPLERIFSRLKDDSGSMEHRLASLLDLKWESDGFLLGKLCRIIKMAKAKGMPVDCRGLLSDLLSWNWDSQSVQRRWARAMYMKNSEINEEE